MSDLISREALCEYALNQKDKSITPNDIMRFPSAQPETHEERTETHACDLISRQAAIEALQEHRNLFCDNTPETFSKLSYAEKSRVDELDMAIATLINLPSAQPEVLACGEGELIAQPEIVRCKDCKEYDQRQTVNELRTEGSEKT